MTPSAELIELLACPGCSEPLQDLACLRCRVRYPCPGGIPSLRVVSDERTNAVRRFYEEAPFPGYPPHENLASLRARARRSSFAQALDAAIPAGARVLELGCGTGQMSLFLASGGRLVVGADLSRPSLQLATQTAASLEIRSALFAETDLQRPGLKPAAFDVVYSSGVLHHTPMPRASFAAMAKLVKPGGVLVLGLYNSLARLPHRLRRVVARLTGYRWIPFDPILRDREHEPARRLAWLRDQYQHPEEHRHTLGEVKRWFRENGVQLQRTYPNTLWVEEEASGPSLFTPADDDWWIEEWLAQVRWMSTLSAEGGLFLVLGRRVTGGACRTASAGPILAHRRRADAPLGGPIGKPQS